MTREYLKQKPRVPSSAKGMRAASRWKPEGIAVVAATLGLVFVFIILNLNHYSNKDRSSIFFAMPEGAMIATLGALMGIRQSLVDRGKAVYVSTFCTVAFGLYLVVMAHFNSLSGERNDILFMVVIMASPLAIQLLGMIHYLTWLFTPEDTFLGRRLFKALSEKRFGLNEPPYQGEEICMAFPELSRMSGQTFQKMTYDYAKLLGENHIAHGWTIDADEAVIYPHIIRGDETAFLIDAFKKPLEGTSIRIRRAAGEITLQMLPRNKKWFKKLIPTEPTMREAAEILRDSFRLFINGKPDVSTLLLFGGKKPPLTICSKSRQGKFHRAFLSVMVLIFVALSFMYYNLFSFFFMVTITKNRAAEFLASSQHKDGSLGFLEYRKVNLSDPEYEKTNKSFLSYFYRPTIKANVDSLQSTARGIYVLAKFNMLDRMDKDRAARFIASHQKLNGAICDNANISDCISYTEPPVEALQLLGRIDLIDRNKLIDTLVSLQRPDGLFDAPNSEANAMRLPRFCGFNAKKVWACRGASEDEKASYVLAARIKFTSICLVTLKRLGGLNRVNVAAAWSRMLGARKNPTPFLEYYLFDTSQTLGLDDHEMRDWIINRVVHRLKTKRVWENEREKQIYESIFHRGLLNYRMFATESLIHYNALNSPSIDNLEAWWKPSHGPTYSYYDGLYSVNQFYPYLLNYIEIEKYKQKHPSRAFRVEQPAPKPRAHSFVIPAIFLFGWISMLYFYAKAERKILRPANLTGTM